ncbi:MAG: cupin domain-containing protein [Canibacter sp.]
MSDQAPQQPFELVSNDQQALIDAVPVSNDRFQIKRVFQTDGFRLIRLAFAPGQIMREHSTPTPLIVQTLTGRLMFRIAGEELTLEPGAVLYVEPNEKHELEAITDTHVLLTLGEIPKN